MKNGVFGAYDMDGGDVAPSVYYGLFALQHRGAGKSWNCSDRYLWQAESSFQKGTRLVNEVFDEEELGKLKGNLWRRTCAVFDSRGNSCGKCTATGSELCERYIGDCP